MPNPNEEERKLQEMSGCEGDCIKHEGKPVTVVIKKSPNSKIWEGMKFRYCERAIAYDTRHGFELEVVDE